MEITLATVWWVDWKSAEINFGEWFSVGSGAELPGSTIY